MQECRVWVWWQGCSLGPINIGTGSGRGQRKGFWPGTKRKTYEIHPNVAELPPPSEESKRGNVRTLPDDGLWSMDVERSCGGSGGYRGLGRGGHGGCRCAVRWRREARWEEIQRAIVWRERTGADPREKQLNTIHQRLLTRTHTHTHTHTQKGMTDRV